MEKLEVKFILNYGHGKRDIDVIATDFEDSIYDFHACFSFETLLGAEEVMPSKILKMNLDEVIKNNYSFKAKSFNCSNLKKGDYGILREKFDGVTRYYLAKIIGVNDFAEHKDLLDKNIAEYINSNVLNRNKYTAKYVSFYTDKNYLLDNNNFISSNISFEEFKEKYKNTFNTLFQPKEKITIEWKDK